MRKNILYIIVFFLGMVFITAQENTPVIGLEIPSHNLLKFNRFIMNPAFSYTGQNESSISMYHRMQWTVFDDGPRLYYAGYTGKLGGKSGIGIGAFQQSVGVFSNTGAILNYSYSAQISDDAYLTFGLNATIYNSGLNTDKVVSIPDQVLMDLGSAFIINAQPGINFSLGNLDVGVYAENVFDYNMSTSEQLTEFGEKTFSGHIQYGYDMENLSGIFENARLVGLVRARKQQEETSFSGSALFDAPSIGWLHLGYESIYGASVGIGFNIVNSFSIGYVIEKGLGEGLNDFGLTHEFSLAYSFNKVENNRSSQSTSRSRRRRSVRRRPVTRPTAPVVQTPPVEETPPVVVEETPPVVVEETTKVADILNAKETPVVQTPPVEETPPVVVEETPPVIVEETPPTVVTPPAVVQQPEVVLTQEDSIRIAREKVIKENELVLEELQKAKQDFVSQEDLDQIALKKAQELYDVEDDGAETLEGVQSGYYIISNTYRTDRYTNVSINRLKKEGIEADFFLNPRDSLNYVYLGRYDTMEGVLEYYKNNDEIAFNNRTSVYKVENDNQDDVVKNEENTAEVRQVLEVPGMEKGFYMITHVFAIPENAEYELQKMREQGLNVNSFVNPKNLYIYIYLESHETFEDAEKAYKSNLNSTYEKEILIMSVNQ